MIPSKTRFYHVQRKLTGILPFCLISGPLWIIRLSALVISFTQNKQKQPEIWILFGCREDDSERVPTSASRKLVLIMTTSIYIAPRSGAAKVASLRGHSDMSRLLLF